MVATEEDKLPTLELKPDVVVATDEDNEPILELNPDVVVAIDELNDVFPPSNELILADTEELKFNKSTPCIVPVNLNEPVISTLSPNTNCVPPELLILLPSWTCIVPLKSIKPVVGSNNTLPPPDAFNCMSPSADCNVIVSEPASNILNDWPLSVVICNSCVVLPNTFVPSIYNDADDKYKCLNGWFTSPKSYEPLTEGIIEPDMVWLPLNRLLPVVAYVFSMLVIRLLCDISVNAIDELNATIELDNEDVAFRKSFKESKFEPVYILNVNSSNLPVPIACPFNVIEPVIATEPVNWCTSLPSLPNMDEPLAKLVVI